MEKSGKNIIINFINRTSLWMQLTAFSVVITSLVAFGLIYKDYTSTKNITLQNQVETTRKILSLEAENMDQYMSSLANFSVQPLYDFRFSKIIEQRTPLSSSQLEYAKQQIYYYYYSRNDLNNYQIYLLNQNIVIGRTMDKQYVRTHTFEDKDIEPIKEQCSNNTLNHCIMPSDTSFFNYYHTLFQIRGKVNQAIVYIAPDMSFLKQILDNHLEHNEIILLFNDNDELIFTNHPEIPVNNIILKNADQSSSGYTLTGIGHENYIQVTATGKHSRLKLVSLTPMNYINSQITHISRSIIISGLFIWVFTVFLTYMLMRLLSRPLKLLSKRMKETGKGNFDTYIKANGSIEVVELAQNFNYMVSHIDELINRTYKAELSEKNAKLTALEAQLNPHFLYNTLQAISTEALVNDQMQIHKMITSLASSLRYTIRGKDLVPLINELDYVKNYIFLQKIRMEDALDFHMHITEDCYRYLVPKVSLQSLIENSIIHGKSEGNIDTIKISVSVYTENELLYIIVEDNGCGISAQKLEELYSDFDLQKETGKYGGIGLANLYTRLHLLYNPPATLEIATQEHKFTRITLILPIRKEF